MMTNKNYMKGYRKERQLVNAARAKGNIAFRSAGSHSPVDVVVIDKKARKIWLIQCKSGNISKSMRKRLEAAQKDLNNSYNISFMVL